MITTGYLIPRPDLTFLNIFLKPVVIIHPPPLKIFWVFLNPLKLIGLNRPSFVHKKNIERKILIFCQEVFKYIGLEDANTYYEIPDIFQKSVKTNERDIILISF